ncbi:venom dipeptidyl peptidase 4-like [Ctenocephalides felis]|uniref:venom dipeptidyl peptidase 4-like n=1 Tax=Ctenocephalides felis TaxID=7515 RepID=UPI000E6E4CEE|nr:venom dipeptidyl peptidase 4-like [Ctenocephalides felis]
MQRPNLLTIEMLDTAFVYKNIDGDLMSYDAKDGVGKTFVKVADIKEFNITGYAVSPNQKYVLFKTDPLQGFRYSVQFKCFIFNVETKEIVHVAREMHVQMAKWIPGSSGLVYVRDNNVFLRRQPNGGSREIQLTLDGEPGVKYNGVSDWVYEEEMLGSGDALWFSPDGAYIAIGCFDDSNVDEMMYFRYGESGTIESQYPELVDLRYPKPGRVNPTAKVKVLRLNEARGRNMPWTELTAPEQDVGKDHLLAAVTWASNNEVAVTWLNRRQNYSVMQICNAGTGECKTELETSMPGWIDVRKFWFTPDGDRYITIRSVQHTDGFTYPHIVGAERRTEPKPITSGNRTVTNIIGFDAERDLIYYSATSTESSTHQEIMVAGSKSLSLTRQLMTQNGDKCRFGKGDFSKEFSYAALTCLGPDAPFVVLYDTVNDEILSTWEDNKDLREKLSKHNRPIVRDLIVKTESGFDALVRLQLPPDFDENLKYPMIVNVYAGPGSKKIVDGFTVGYPQYVTTNKKYIHCEIDGRGSAFRSDELMFQVNNALGTAEIEDQIAITKKLTEMFQFIDSNRVSIWGWSYGGYATAMTLIRDKENVFKCGVSVAPVTSWLYYDTIYTERYMGTPTENPEGYNNSDVTLLAEGLRNKRYLLIHGNADDNVHYQHSMQLARTLELKDIPFQSQSYPNEAHALSNVLAHVYHTIDNFFCKCFI